MEVVIMNVFLSLLGQLVGQLMAYFIVGSVAIWLVWLSVGCAPLAYMAHNGQPEQDPVVTEEPRDDARGVLEALLRYDCIPAWVFVEKSSVKITVAQGCQKNEQELLPKLLGR